MPLFHQLIYFFSLITHYFNSKIQRPALFSLFSPSNHVSFSYQDYVFLLQFPLFHQLIYFFSLITYYFNSRFQRPALSFPALSLESLKSKPSQIVFSQRLCIPSPIVIISSAYVFICSSLCIVSSTATRDTPFFPVLSLQPLKNKLCQVILSQRLHFSPSFIIISSDYIFIFLYYPLFHQKIQRNILFSLFFFSKLLRPNHIQSFSHQDCIPSASFVVITSVAGRHASMQYKRVCLPSLLPSVRPLSLLQRELRIW